MVGGRNSPFWRLGGRGVLNQPVDPTVGGAGVWEVVGEVGGVGVSGLRGVQALEAVGA